MLIYDLKTIETPRLLIRPVQLGDEVKLNQLINHSLTCLQKWQAWAKDPSLATTKTFINHGVRAWQSCSMVDFPMVVMHKHDSVMIGVSGFNDHSLLEDGIYEVGYWLDIDYHGQGLATECANALTRYALEGLHAHQVLIRVWRQNTKSAAIVERLHYQYEGIQKREAHECVSDKDPFDLTYACSDIAWLPPLEVQWACQGGDR